MTQLGTVETPTARKPHRCWWCAERIEPGEKYNRWVWKDGRDLLAVKCHPECYDAWAEIGGEEVDYGDFCRGCTCEAGRCECGRNPTERSE